MSIINKYLRQQAKIERIGSLLDIYGDPIAPETKTVRCRRESVLKDVATITGAVVKSDTRYFLGPTNQVAIGDKIDDRQVVGVEKLIGSNGQTVGYFAYVT